MPHKTPAWWYDGSRVLPALLSPVSLVWNSVAKLHWTFSRKYSSKLPVICIGNLTAGGAGKTPAALAIARILQQEGAKPAFLTRGYGGRKKGPHLVDRNSDLAGEVGDEPLLLSRVAPTVVAADRAKGAQLIETLEADVIIMDDGFQNPGLTKDLSILVIDCTTGIGNGRVLPAGPLRANLDQQLARAQAVVMIGDGSAGDALIPHLKAFNLALFDAEIQVKDKATWLKSEPVIAFAGIGNPDKFFAMIEKLGGQLKGRVAFPDHHVFSRHEADDLLRRAKDEDALLVTTEKDLARIDGTDGLERLKREVKALPVRLRFKDQGRLKRQLSRTLKRR